MERPIASLNKLTARRIRKQAAWWVMELHAPDRDAALEEKVRHWIAQDPRHAAAFELGAEAGNRPATSLELCRSAQTKRYASGAAPESPSLSSPAWRPCAPRASPPSICCATTVWRRGPENKERWS